MAEAVVLALVCLSPWAYGAVDAWAELAIAVGLVALAALTVAAPGEGLARRWFGPTSFALAALSALAAAQALPLPAGALSRIAPGVTAWRVGLAPSRLQAVLGDRGAPVPPPSPTLSLEPESSAHAALELAAAWVLFQAVLAAGGGAAAYRRFAAAVAVNAGLLALFSAAQSLAWDGRIYGVRPTGIADGWLTGGPFVCHNHLAAALNIGLGLALGLLFGGPRAGGGRALGSNLAFVYLAGVIAVGLLASHSRGGFLAMAVSATAAFVASRQRGLRVELPLAAVAATAALFLAVMGSASPLARLATIVDAGATGFNGRTEVWRAALGAWRISPVFGTGLGSFAAASAPFFDRDRGVFFSHAESEYLQVLTEGGLVGLGLALAGLVAVARAGAAALAGAATRADRAAVAGGLCALLALAVQCLSDFPLHIPAVGLTAVALAAHLCRLAIGARVPVVGPPRRDGALVSVPAGLALVAVASAVLWHQVRQARAEAAVAEAGLPLPGATVPTLQGGRATEDGLRAQRAALEAALEQRPDWPEGHLRLALTLSELYEETAYRWLLGTLGNRPAAARWSRVLWLHGVAHGPGVAAGDVVAQEPVRDYLVPAARSFLEARRCSPNSALAHAGLAGLDYLLPGREPAPVHAARAIRLAGADGRVASAAARAAAQAGDPTLAERGWRRALAVGVSESAWVELADAASRALPPDALLDRVLCDSGRDTIRFACHYYTAPADTGLRERFLRAGIGRLRREPDVTPSDRDWFEGEARAWLGETGPARDLMRRAVAADPGRDDRRRELVDWLICWDDAPAALREARAGAAYDPRARGNRRALRAAVDALAGPKARPAR